MYSYLSPEERVRADHPLRAIRAMADEALQKMSKRFDAIYAKTGRPSIPPEKLLRAQLSHQFGIGIAGTSAAGAAALRPLVLTNAYVFSWRLAERNGILALTASVVSTYAD